MTLPLEDRDLTYEQAEQLALRAIHDTDGRGMIGRGRNHLHQRVARAILAASGSQAAPVVDEAYIERIVEAFERATEFSWSCNLTRLVDGDRTYTLTTPEGSEDFGGVSEAHERLDEIKSMRRRAALEAALTQPNGGEGTNG